MAARLHSVMVVAMALACARGPAPLDVAQDRLEVTVSLGRIAGRSFEPGAISAVPSGDQTFAARVDAPAGMPLKLCSWGVSPNLRLRGRGCGVVPVLPFAAGPARIEAVVIAADGREAIVTREFVVEEFVLAAARSEGMQISADILTRGALSFVTAPEVAGATYEWTLTGAATEGSADGPRLAFHAPAGGAVEVRCKVTTPDHAQVVLQRSFETVPPPLAAVEAPSFARPGERVTLKVPEQSFASVAWLRDGEPAGEGREVAFVAERTANWSVSVKNRAGDEATASATVHVARIDRLDASAARLTRGESVDLEAVFSGGEGRIDPDIGEVSSGAKVTITPQRTTAYTLTVRTPAGNVAQAETRVAVLERPTVSRFEVSKVILTRGEHTSLLADWQGGQGSIDGIGKVQNGVSLDIAPAATTTYALRVRNEAGAEAVQRATVEVVPSPAVESFKAEPSMISEGGHAALRISFSGQGDIDGAAALPGERTVSPVKTTTYTLSVRNAAGALERRQATVEVVPRPSLLRFAVEPAKVLLGEQARLVAVFSGGKASLDPQVGAVVSGKPVAITPASTTTYTLTVTSPAGERAVATATVQVAAAPSIRRFQVSPERVLAPGAQVTLTAVFENGSAAVQGIGAVQSGAQVKIAPRASQDLVLSVQGEVGNPVTANARVEVAGTGAKLLLLPLVSYGPTPAPLKDLRQSLRKALEERGITPIDDAKMEGFLARHRIRNTSGVDRETAIAAAQDLGADGLVVTSVDQYQETAPLKLLVTMRLVSAASSAEILWIDGAGHVGDESPGFLDLGVMTDMGKLRSKTFGDIAGSLAAFLKGQGPKATACAGGGRFDPRVALRSPRLDASRSYTVVVLPFTNQSSRRHAGELLEMDFVRNLSAVPGFTVVEPGRAAEELLRYRIILEGGVSLDLARVVTEVLQADLILTGSVRDFFDPVSGGAPKVQFSAMLLDRVRNDVLWDATSWNRGDDGVFFFELGSVATAGQLACRMSRTAVDAMTRLRVAMPRENPVANAQELRGGGPAGEREVAAQPLQLRGKGKGDRR